MYDRSSGPANALRSFSSRMFAWTVMTTSWMNSTERLSMLVGSDHECNFPSGKFGNIGSCLCKCESLNLFAAGFFGGNTDSAFQRFDIDDFTVIVYFDLENDPARFSG